MGLITEEVEVELNGRVVNHYEDKGYKIPRTIDNRGRITISKGTKIKVKTVDLPVHSNIKIDCECDNCKNTMSILYGSYTRYLKNGKYYCVSCARKIYRATELARLTKLNNGISFKDWCKVNNYENYLYNWDYELNTIAPHEIGFSSNVKCYFKCPNKIHKSELKSINSLTNNKNNSGIYCHACNSIGQYLEEKYGNAAIETYWSYKNMTDPFSVAKYSDTRLYIKCKTCNNEKMVRAKDFVKNGIGCPKCSDGISYGEKFMFSFIEQTKEKFNTQHIFKWAKNKRYDFYLINKKIIIETHGIQHYIEVNRGRSLIAEKENDNLKKQLALNNCIEKENYIVIDCRISDMEHIKLSILNSNLSKMFDLSAINWLACHEYACNSLIKLVCNYWNNGTHNTKEISDIVKISRSTVTKYLKHGAINNWCDYDSIDESVKNLENKNKKVICIELNSVFNSLIEASRLTKTNVSGIGQCCRGMYKTSGGYHWMYYDDYLKLHNETSEVSETKLA